MKFDFGIKIRCSLVQVTYRSFPYNLSKKGRRQVIRSQAAGLQFNIKQLFVKLDFYITVICIYRQALRTTRFFSANESNIRCLKMEISAPNTD